MRQKEIKTAGRPILSQFGLGVFVCIVPDLGYLNSHVYSHGDGLTAAMLTLTSVHEDKSLLC